MTAVLVHGVPETTSVWRSLVDRLGRDDVALLGLPGFGSPLPDGFEPTMHTYAEWLATELAAFDTVDLVAHDWGAILALRVLARQPANVRSWVSDMGDLSADFQWHDTAKIWQTPVAGEELIDGFVSASLADRAAILMAVGVPESGAGEMAEHLDETMGAAILTLYRSAIDVGNEWGPGIDSIRGPGLLIESQQDPFRSAVRVKRLAARTGAAVAVLPDAGHFWMLDSPDRAAEIITKFWAGI
jgi:pimeloyl-ACP methyl ester carboxylesterase